MKKLLLIIILLLILLKNSSVYSSKEETRAIFISYIELQEYMSSKSEEKIKSNIKLIINNIKKIKTNTIILQVRSATDAIYKSNLFPTSRHINQELKFDLLKYFIKESHKNNIKLIAWINPYRISTNEKIESIPNNSPAKKFIGTDTIYVKNGIYWNPSKEETNKIILKGIDEVLKYKVDGILLDDYFYPDNEIDRKDYEDYLKENKEVSIEEYHLNIVNNLIKKIYNKCQKRNVKFGISPDGNIENNYQKNFADVKEWMSKNGYIDFIMPQIYYGFYNSTKGYYKVLKEWESLLKNDEIELLVALAFYKIGREDNYAKDGKFEWIENNNIIMREILLSRNIKNYTGYALFRYDFIFNENYISDYTKNELELIKKINE